MTLASIFYLVRDGITVPKIIHFLIISLSDTYPGKELTAGLT